MTASVRKTTPPETAAAPDAASGNPPLNVPNVITSARLVVSLVLFVFLSFEWYLTGLVLFILGAATDWVDGYWARKYGQITVLGRILDPFADKIIICGSFVYLAAAGPESEVRAWMAVVVIGRELLVTALRSFLEQRGSDFSASVSGKLKMVLQCLAVGFSLFRLSYGEGEETPTWLAPSLVVLVWSAVVLTVYSGLAYVLAAVRMMREKT